MCKHNITDASVSLINVSNNSVLILMCFSVSQEYSLRFEQTNTMLLYLKGCSGGSLAQQHQPVPDTGVLRHQIGWETCTKWNRPLWEWQRDPIIKSWMKPFLVVSLYDTYCGINWSTQKLASKVLLRIKEHLGLIYVHYKVMWPDIQITFCQANPKLLVFPSNNVGKRPLVFKVYWKYCWEKS